MMETKIQPSEFFSSFPLPSQKQHDAFMLRMKKRKLAIKVEPGQREQIETFIVDGRIIQLSQSQLNRKGYFRK